MAMVPTQANQKLQCEAWGKLVHAHLINGRERDGAEAKPRSLKSPLSLGFLLALMHLWKD